MFKILSLVTGEYLKSEVIYSTNQTNFSKFNNLFPRHSTQTKLRIIKEDSTIFSTEEVAERFLEEYRYTHAERIFDEENNVHKFKKPCRESFEIIEIYL